ncbi:TolC family outer membrane protein [uncultured Methylovirgula sp.]|uniref:TolC family outer membrane protein n=1 Tax=uncultured Methylovirgula sp. TaxID=1285960 RepID=UPI00261C154A|nr:TolC family outer membrane protein [uncultured Methylovirgula sp.]
MALAATAVSGARAETMSSALARAYQSNPDLNQQRAGVRAQDENVPRATSAYRPTVTATGQFGYSNLALHEPGTVISPLLGLGTTGTSGSNFNASTDTGALGVTVTQTIFNGNRNYNGVRQAESNVLGARETLRNTEESVLQNGATAYMNVLRDTAILDLRKNNIIVLEEQLRQTRDRFNVGEVTRTDVAQAASSLASARSDYFTALANLETSIANYHQVIGIDPTRLQPARSVEALLPHTLNDAIAVALQEHPEVQAALHQVDSAELQVKLMEGQLMPTVTVNGQVAQNYNEQGEPGLRLFNATILGEVSVPIYTGGDVDAQVRQAKEQLSQAELQADLQRTQVRALVVSNWGLLDSAKAVIVSDQAAVKSAEIALEGVREEARVGQRTTLDVLNAQQTLLNARVSLVSAQRDRVVASYATLAAVGQLSADSLGLDVVRYDPTVHFNQVKDKWFGLRTPDGR